MSSNLQTPPGESWLRPLAAVIAGLLAVVLFAVATPALASESAASFSPPRTVEVEIQNDPRLVARGAGVRITIGYECTAGYNASMIVDVAQRAGNGLAYGSDFRQVQCTGRPEAVSVLVIAYPNSRPYRPGPAIFSVNLHEHFSQFSDSDQEVFRIRP